MNLYKRALRHIDMAKVKKNVIKENQEKFNKKIVKEISNNHHSPYSNWRFELPEDMTSQLKT